MAKKNWYVEAQQSQDPIVKSKLEMYHAVDMNQDGAEERKKALSDEIKVLLGLIEKPSEPEQETENEPEKSDIEPTDETPVPDAAELNQDVPEQKSDSESAEVEPEKPAEPEPEKKTEEPKKDGFQYTEDDAKKAKDIETLEKIQAAVREETERLEKTRLKHATYHENLALNNKKWAIERIGHIARLRKAALKEREHRVEKMKKVNNLAIKRARFVKLQREGISITNITKHPNGVAKEDLIKVLDADTIEACRKNNSRFPEMWDAWKAKFIDKADEKK